jgi:hypothetical protein
VAKIPPGVGPRFPQVVVLFGATGDLAKRKLLPGLFHLSSAGFIPGCRIIGVSLDDIDTDGFRTAARSALGEFFSRKIPDADWEAFSASLDYVPLSIGANALKAAVDRAEQSLGKDPAQNILAFRFANGLFEPIWNRNFIDHIQIDVPETLGLGKRSGFYEQTGAYRDMVVTHLFQILASMAMEPPTSLEPMPISEEKNKVFRSMLPIQPADVVRGQYSGYRSEEGVDPDSDTETFIALKCHIDNWRWVGVPFYLLPTSHRSTRLAAALRAGVAQAERAGRLTHGNAAGSAHRVALLFQRLDDALPHHTDIGRPPRPVTRHLVRPVRCPARRRGVGGKLRHHPVRQVSDLRVAQASVVDPGHLHQKRPAFRHTQEVAERAAHARHALIGVPAAVHRMAASTVHDEQAAHAARGRCG